FDGVDGSFFQRIGKAAQGVDAIQFAALAQRAGPGEEGGHRVGGSLLALEVFVVVAGHGAVGSLVLVVAVGRDQYRGHHGQGTEGGGDHIAHHVAVVVLAGPDETAPGADDPGHRVVDEGVEV